MTQQAPSYGDPRRRHHNPGSSDALTVGGLVTAAGVPVDQVRTGKYNEWWLSRRGRCWQQFGGRSTAGGEADIWRSLTSRPSMCSVDAGGAS